ncbi:unnamed protein product [Rotaria sp. Silwood1]|nr:unnamed protein product [Rotaria sp. Silwood1]CAF1258222.1 unnamed protein product [Rotaria sp. Silwood1]CAF3500929.1 unnamed protein product [Rotaria sp. Silwood1]CAF3509719.1 unnamed protein product [Rotaria sp. Silwood1]CAF3518733.1 unnamed protein product [Rotaria sp. Silwood1]
MVIQAKPLHESAIISNGNKLTKNYQQLYELYKIMREDPRLASVSNYDIVLFIYRNFISNTKSNMNFMKPEYSNYERNQQQDNKFK